MIDRTRGAFHLQPELYEPGVAAGQPWSSHDWSAAHETFGTSTDPAFDEVRV
jgi:hypothetical protein